MSVIRIEDIAHVRYAAPDLAAMRGFLEDFGLGCFESGGRLYGKGSDGRPFVHVTEPGEARFLAIGLRAAGRRVCPSCEGIFHIASLTDPLVCPVCGARLVQRPDDQPETISRRLTVYHAQTEPLIEYYRERGRHSEICGEYATETVRDKIFELLERMR